MDQLLAELLARMQESILETIPNKQKNIGIAFSGGVDSSLVSKICSDMKYNITLLTIGFAQSHDMLFSSNVNSYFNYTHHLLEIDPDNFLNISLKIKHAINTDNLSWLENCIAFYNVSKLANNLGLDTVITANGIDELFCGYNIYKEIFVNGEAEIYKVMNEKLDNELKMMQAVNLVSAWFGVKIIQPLLTSSFIDYAKTIPICEKINDSNDLYRKHVIRKLARQINVPEISCTKRKKALQYGTKIHRMLLKSK